MTFEDQVRQQLADRAGSLGSAPDGRDLARRIHRAERRAQRVQHLMLAAALVVVAGSSGAVLGAFATRPNSTPKSFTPETVGTDVSQSTTPSTLPTPPTSTAATAGGGPATTTTQQTPPTTLPTESGVGPSQGFVGGASSGHTATLDGLQVDWLTTPLDAPVTVVAPGAAAACLPASIVTVSVGGDTPVAGGSGVLGLPALESNGMAVVASGSFGSLGRPGGWWAIVETGSSASTVAVQFPSGVMVHEAVVNGLAVLAALAPTGTTEGAYSGYASAVADDSTGVTSSLEFVVGGPPATVSAAPGPTSRGTSPAASVAGTCLSAPQLGLPASSSGQGSARSHTVVGSHGSGNTSPLSPADPITSAGEVVAAFEQAYDIDPLLGLDWSFGAVDLGGPNGCSLSSLSSVGASSGAQAGTVGDELLPPRVAIDAVAFVTPDRAVVIYQRGSGLRESGSAVLSDGAWKVNGATYCADTSPSTSTP